MTAAALTGPDLSPDPSIANGRWSLADGLIWVARIVLGAGYLYLGTMKVTDPVGFLKAIRQYDIVSVPLILNLVAVILPWIEVCCGAFLVAGVAVRGSALVSLGMLIPFTALVLRRALELQEAGALPFCAVRFDCGCGAGEIAICHKLLENGILMAISVLLLFSSSRRGCLRHTL